MRKGKSVILSLLIILILFLGLRFTILALRDSEGNKKGPPVQCYSASIEESKKNGVFQFAAVPNKHRFSVGNSLICEIKSSWVENMYNRQALMFGTSPIDRSDDHFQLMITLNFDSTRKENLQYFYFFGNQPLDTLIHIYCENEHSLDTIRVPIYRSTTDQFSTNKGAKAFTLVFTKKLTNH